ncbi:efflux transporter outer membrane subunit [Niveispirillum fermenti]|uniref:efflux transporter outer membrane subunit n=1 Tax=Niveispirillum fermenti TaxID=1233113 RepID=UPI003A8A763C
MKMKSLFACLFGTLLVGCAAGPDHIPPSPPSMGTAFLGATPDMVAGTEPETAWWRLYDDPVLEALVARALEANTDLRVAMANLKAADAVLAEARDSRMPQTQIEGRAAYGRNQPPIALPGDRFTYGGGLQLSYEADMFGRVSRVVEAAEADAAAMAFAQAAVQVKVVAAVTEAYLSICTLSQATDVANAAIALTSDSARIIRQQQEAGGAAILDVERAEGLAAQARAGLAPLEGALVAAQFELSALLGQPPAGMPEQAVHCRVAPQPRHAIGIGDRAGLLRRRPDIAEAERRLAGSTARVGVAMADLYPRINIAANISQMGGEGIGNSQGFAYGLGPLLSFSFPNMEAARVRIRQAEAQAEAALAAFDGVVLTALKEAEQALNGYKTAHMYRREIAEAERRAERAYYLAEERYRAGDLAFIDVLVAQSALIELSLARVDADRGVAIARVDVFRALGNAG